MEKLKIGLLAGVLVVLCIGLTSCIFSDGPTDNVAPVASFDAVIAGLTVSFDGSNSEDIDGDIVSWEWDFEDGEFGDEETDTHTYDSAGTYAVSLTVADNDGVEGETTRDITVDVMDIAPIARFGFGIQTDSRTVSFDATLSQDTEPGEIVSAEWDFGDGSPVISGDWTYLDRGNLYSVMREVEYEYARPNYADTGISRYVVPYIVKLTVFDSGGNSASIAQEVLIVEIVE